MPFTLGNLLTIAIVLVILIVYRQLDVNNRSLDKMKKYSIKIKDELDSIVEEKALRLKDLAIELDVHKKTVKEVYNRIEEQSAKLLNRSLDLENVNRQINSYDNALKELAEQTLNVDENLKKLHEESIFADGIGKRINETAISLEELEKRIPTISEEFEKKNREGFDILKINILNDVNLKINTVKDEIEESKEDVQEFRNHIEELEKRRDSLGNELISNVKGDLDNLEGDFRKNLLDAKSKGNHLIEDTLSKIKHEIEEKAEDLNIDVTGNLSMLEDKIGEELQKASDSIVSFESKIKKLHDESVFVDEIEKRVGETALYIGKLEKRIPAISEEFEKKNREGFDILKINILNDVNLKINTVKDEIEESKEDVQEFRNHIEELETRRDSMGDEVLRNVKGDLENLEEDFRKNLLDAESEGNRLIEDTLLKIKHKVEEKTEDLNVDVTGNLVTMEDRIKEEFQKASDSIVSFESKIKKLQDESVFVDGIEKKVDKTALSIEKLENRIPTISKEFEKKNSEGFDILKINILNDVELKANTIKDKIEESKENVQEFRNYIEELEKRRDSMGDEILGNVKGDLENLEEDFKKNLLDAESEGNRLIEDTLLKIKHEVEKKTEDLNVDVTENMVTLEDRIKEEFQKISNSMVGFESEIKEKYSDIKDNTLKEYKYIIDNVDQFQNAVEGKIDYIGTMKNEIEIMTSTFYNKIASWKEDANEIEEKQKTASSEFTATIKSNTEEFITNYTAKTEEIGNKYVKMLEVGSKKAESYQNSLIEEVKKDIVTRTKETKEELLKQIHDSNRQVLSDISKIDSEISDFESGINYRMEAVEGFGKDIEKMEKNLHAMMDKVSRKMQEDFHLFEASLEMEKDAQKAKLDYDFSEMRTVAKNLEEQIDELKKKSYKTVAEKLQVFEDEFFKDLKTKTDEIDKKLNNWQGETDERIEKIIDEKYDVREEIENKYVETFRTKITEIQGDSKAQFQKYENQISIYKNEVDEKLYLIEHNVSDFESSMKTETEDIKASSFNHFSKEFANYQISMEERLRSYEKEVTKIIDAIKEEYIEERDKLIEESVTERGEFKQQISDIAMEIGRLHDDLREKARNSLEKAKSDSEVFLSDFMRKTREFENNVDNKVTDCKMSMTDLKENLETTEKKVMGKIGDSSKLLLTVLDDIDKKQRNFVNQTKVFERADNLKLALQEKIEMLKNDIIKTDAQSKDIKTAEKKFEQVRKLGDEVSIKLNRFLGEKKKIDEIEGDFKKLLNMSQAVDLKLEHVTNIYDNVQEIDAKLRGFDIIFKDVTNKFARLEKKEAIIDATTVGVDKNFQALQTIEKNIADIIDTANGMPMRLNELEERYKRVNIEKEEAEKTMEKLSQLSNILTDVENRMNKIQNSRQWLAQTETRINESVKKGEDHIKLLGALIEKESGGKKSQKGAPSVDKRDMVVKLAGQGWKSAEIAKAAELSIGEVELILEIMPRK